MMDIFIPTSSTLSQPHDAINSIIRENNDEDRNISKLVENNNITAMLVKGPRYWVKTLLNSGCNCSIFTDRSMFRDYNEYRVPIQTAGGTISSTGRGTVGHLQNCLHVPDLNMNLLSTHHVTQYIDDIGIEFQRHICVVRHLFDKFENIVIPYVDGLVDVQDMSWFGVTNHTPESVALHTQELNQQRHDYIQGVTKEAMVGNLESLKAHLGRHWLTDERREECVQSYVAKAEALEILHMQLGHLPYQRIERLIQKGVIEGFKIDKQLVDALVKERCDICMQSKQRDASHGGKLPLPTEAWRRISTDLSAKFAHPSIYGNIYQMAFIDTKTKYVWDYNIDKKDKCFQCIQEWLEGEVSVMRGRDKGDFEITLFSDLGEAESKKIHRICNQYGVVKQSTAGYTPEHNAFVERWFRTNAEMSRCQMLQFDSPEALWEDSRKMATFIYNRVPPTKSIPGEP